MNQKKLFDKVSIGTSRLTTLTYSTSFSLGIRCLDRHLQNPIYSIYGFVRFTDEIVDTFHDYDKKELFSRFREDTWTAIRDRISLNPVLNAFQATVHQFNIEHEHITQFFQSMEMDLTQKHLSVSDYEKYILGSSQAVGLMCLRVFCHDKKELYAQLQKRAMKLGAAFQKVNFLRDMQEDVGELGRSYFPGVEMRKFNDDDKRRIEMSIAEDFHEAYLGIKRLPRSARLGVYVAYLYYRALFHKIRKLPSSLVSNGRVRIRNRYKLAILGYSYVKHQLNLI